MKSKAPRISRRTPLQRHRLNVGPGLLTLVAAVFVLSTGCEDELDFTRDAPERGTFGEEVHRILLNDIERSPDRGRTRADVFATQRDDFVSAVDATAPDPILDELDATLIRMLPLYDDRTLNDLMRKVAIVLDEARQDPELLEAMATSARRPELIADPSRDQFLSHLVSFDQMQDLNRILADTLLAHDGVTDPGQSEDDSTTQLLLALSLELREAEASGDNERFAATLADVLLTTDPTFAPEASYTPMWAVRLDGRGLPIVAAGELEPIPAPFVDTDGDGLADATPDGRFLGLDGQPMDAVTPFGEGTTPSLARDGDGKLLNPSAIDGQAFEYVDLHATALGFLMREAAPLADADVPFDMLRALPVALGEPNLYQDEHGSWRGYRADAPLVGLARGMMFALDHEDVPAVLEGFSLLMKNHRPDMANMMQALDETSEIADRHEDDVSEDSNLMDDLQPLLLEVVETPGLLKAVMLAMDDPVARRTGEAMAMLMRYKNDFITVTPGGAYDACFHDCKATHTLGTVERFECIRACPNDEIFAQEVDRGAPESASNVSLFQRTQALMWEAVDVPYEVGLTSMSVNGTSFDNTAQALGAAMIFEDLAEAYLLTLVGELRLEDMINPDVAALGEPLGLDGETVVAIITFISGDVMSLPLDPEPTPDQVTRFFNKDPLEGDNGEVAVSMNPAVCKSGRLCIDAHADTLFAVEASGLADTLVPLARAFHEHGKTDLLARIFAVVYSHYPSRGRFFTDIDGNEIPFARDNLRSLEPMLIEMLEDGAMLDAMADMGPVMSGIQLADGSGMMAPMSRHLAWVLTPDASLTLADGSQSTVDPRGNAVPSLSPFYLILDPLRKLDDAFDENPAAKEAWERATEAAADLMLETTDDGTGARFVRPGGPLLAALAIDAMRDAWLDEEAAGTRTTWLREDVTQDLTDVMTGRALHAGVTLFQYIDQDPERVAMLQRASLHALEAGQAAPELMLIFAYGLLAGALDEEAGAVVSRFLGRAIDPTRDWIAPDGAPSVEIHTERGLVLHGLVMLDRSADADPQGVVLDVAANGMQTRPDGRTHLGVIWDVIKEVNRVEPGAGTPLTADDYASILEVTVDFMRDDERGMERLFDFVDFAIHGPDGRPDGE